MNGVGAQQSDPWWVLALEKRYPSKTEIQALACICSLDNRLVCLKNLSNHLFSPLECLLGWLLPFLAQQTRSWKWKSSKVSRLLLITVMGAKQRSRSGRDHWGRHLNATFRIYVCTHTQKATLTSTDKYTHIHTLSTFLGDKSTSLSSS